jgi:hypothetical protein
MLTPENSVPSRVAVLQGSRRLDGGLARVAMRADHAIDLDLELSARSFACHQNRSSNTRVIAGLAGFLILSHVRERPCW